MSSIERLNILGIRSFDHTGTGQNIEFKAPLTLIVGDNGCGKTTIIEALKYGSTGELPPGAQKNGAFVHDPKIANEPAVLGQVKLKFRTMQGVSYIVSRRIKSTVLPGGGYKQQTLETNMVVETKDERASHSLKTKQVDQQVPQFMGVSPAILSNVIFCHQDESLWPMGESKTLKEKFDQIFEAEKYSKAIVNVGQLKKDYTQKSKILEVEEKNSKINLNASKRFSKRIEDVADGIEDKRGKIEALDVDIAAAVEVYNEKQKLMRDAERVVNEMENKRQKIDNIQYTLEKLRGTLKERHEPTAWLESTLAEFEQQMRDHERQASNLEQEYKKIIDDLASTRKKLSRQQQDLGNHTAQARQHEANLQDRVKMVKDAAADHKLREYDGELDDRKIKDFMSRVKDMEKAKDRELNRAKQDTGEEVRKYQDLMTKIQGDLAGLKEKRTNATAQKTINDKNIRSKQAKMDDIHMDEGIKARLDTSLREAKEQLKSAESALQSAGWDTKLASAKKRLLELEGEDTRLRKEVMQRTRTMKDVAELELARNEAKQAQKSLDTMIAAHGEQLTTFIAQELTPRTLQRDYNAALAELDVRISNARKAKAQADKVYHEHSFKLQTLNSELSKKTSEVERCNTSLLESITASDGRAVNSVEEYLKEFKILEKEHEEAREDLDAAGWGSKYYTKALLVIQNNQCCRLCERGFANTNEKSAATEKVKLLLEKYVLDNLKKDFETLDTDLKKAQSARPQYEIWKRLVDTEIPALKKEIKALEQKSQSFRSSCEKQDEKLEAVEADKRDAKSLEHSVLEITKYNTEIAKQEDRVTRLSSQQKLSGSTSTLEEIEKQQASCQEDIKSIKAEIERLTTERDAARTEKADSERNMRDILAEVTSAQNLLEKKQSLLDSINSDRENTKAQNALISKADGEFATKEPELAKHKEQRDEAQRRGDQKAATLQGHKNKLEVTVTNLNTIERNINNYLTSGGPGKLAACEQEIASLESTVKRLDNERVDITNKGNEIKDLLADSAITKRSIQDNLLYRQSLEDKKKLEEEIFELQSRNTREEYEHLLKEARNAEKNKTLLNAERTRLEIQMTSEDEHLKSLSQQWVQEYEGVEKKWQEQNIRFQTTTAVSQDLQKCITALDKAIIAFHTKKMEDVNSIAADLWRSTYQGTDVDTIMIKSEGSNSTSTTMRKFDYRLVMIKQDAELDMRSRCSAGQRVLACIIIRLALAESFGSSCGVIALDEPTTNLDSDNIKALARSLHQIIQSRKHQKNFQLLVITHDEAFIREMQCRDFTDDYWRVSRNENQNSKIKKQNLSIIDED